VDAFSAASRNLGLFGGRKMIDLRIPGGKPRSKATRSKTAPRIRALMPSCSSPCRAPIAPRRRARSSPRRALRIAVQALERAELPAWIAGRLARAGQRASAETLQFLADTTEGNLLAAQQEIEKLGLLLPAGELEPRAVEQAIADVARFDVFQLSEAWLAGDAARACRILASLEDAGEGVPLLVWQLGEDLHALAAVFTAVAGGTHISAALRNARVWGKRQPAMERAARRLQPTALPSLLIGVARLDALAKGIGRGNVWDELREVALALAGRPLPAAA
jgi:DNA polymerase-3 subunit delta